MLPHTQTTVCSGTTLRENITSNRTPNSSRVSEVSEWIFYLYTARWRWWSGCARTRQPVRSFVSVREQLEPCVCAHHHTAPFNSCSSSKFRSRKLHLLQQRAALPVRTLKHFFSFIQISRVHRTESMTELTENDGSRWLLLIHQFLQEFGWLADSFVLVRPYTLLFKNPSFDSVVYMPECFGQTLQRPFSKTSVSISYRSTDLGP